MRLSVGSIIIYMWCILFLSCQADDDDCYEDLANVNFSLTGSSWEPKANMYCQDVSEGKNELALEFYQDNVKGNRELTLLIIFIEPYVQDTFWHFSGSRSFARSNENVLYATFEILIDGDGIIAGYDIDTTFRNFVLLTRADDEPHRTVVDGFFDLRLNVKSNYQHNVQILGIPEVIHFSNGSFNICDYIYPCF